MPKFVRTQVATFSAPSSLQSALTKLGTRVLVHPIQGFRLDGRYVTVLDILKAAGELPKGT